MRRIKQKYIPPKFKISWRHLYYGFMSFLGLLLTIWGIMIFRRTIISPYTLWMVVLFAGMLAFMCEYQNFKSTYSESTIIAFIQSLVSWGGIFYFLFLASNYYLCSDLITDNNFSIVQKGSMPGKTHRQPTVDINFYGEQKELIFSHDERDKVANAKAVHLTTKRGFLGYDIIVEAVLQ